MNGSTLLCVFDSLLSGEEIGVDGVNIDDEGQLREFLDRLFRDPQLKRLAILDTPIETLRELLRSTDHNVRMSAAYTLMDRKFPQLNLISYV